MDESHWAISSGSTTLHSDVPSILDNVIFDENSFSTHDQIVTIPKSSDLSLQTMDWSKVSFNVMLDGGLEVKFNVYGSLVFGEKVTPNIRYINFLGKGDQIVEAGKDGMFGAIASLTFDGDGIWNINSAINANKVEYKHGTVNTNGNAIHIFYTVFSSLRKKDINFGTSDYFSNKFELSRYNDSLTLNAGQSTISIEKDFFFDNDNSVNLDIDMMKVHFVNPEIVGRIKCNIEIGILEIDAGKEISIDKDLEIILSELIANGNANLPIKIHSSENGIQCSIKKVSGEVHGEYLELQDIEGTGGAAFYATNSTNQGNVTGWIFGPVSTNTPKYISVSAFPNPTTDNVYINLGNSKKGNYKIYDTLGKMIKSTSFKNGDEVLEISMEALVNGIYFVKIQCGKEYYQARIVKK